MVTLNEERMILFIQNSNDTICRQIFHIVKRDESVANKVFVESREICFDVIVLIIHGNTYIFIGIDKYIQLCVY